MGSANTHEDLVRIVLDGLLEAVPAEVGAILSIKEGRELAMGDVRRAKMGRFDAAIDQANEQSELRIRSIFEQMSKAIAAARPSNVFIAS